MKGNIMDLQGDGWKVLAGSCLDRLPELADESVDAVVCDPPYELGFMGKSWDSSGIAYDVNVWRECLRVLKPGGHVLAFGGSRTWHRLAVAVEDAGFELRDSIAWLYGSGFPKSLDVSKAIDKRSRGHRVIELIDVLLSEGATLSQLGEKSGIPSLESNYRDWTDGGHAPEERSWYRLLEGLGFSEDDGLKIIERKTVTLGGGNSYSFREGETRDWEIKKVSPSTPDAQKWQGWGTALKPAFEPVVVGRKPLIGTVAANVLAYGVGGLNIDATRIGTSGATKKIDPEKGSESQNAYGTGLNGGTVSELNAGRWPSNVILDEYTAALVDEQSGERPGMATQNSSAINIYGGNSFHASKTQLPDVRQGYNDSGGASRFFYIAKANKRDRNEGLDGLPEIRTGAMQATADGTMLTGSGNERTTVRQNFHPTVKPTELMRQLIRLVTPPSGVVLDPFTGSGSTGKAAILEGMQFIGCELTEDYLPIIQGRIECAVDQVKQDKLQAEQDAAEVLF